jgi:ribosomal protein L7Ae-like RNA K-turn-binding protein
MQLPTNTVRPNNPMSHQFYPPNVYFNPNNSYGPQMPAFYGNGFNANLMGNMPQSQMQFMVGPGGYPNSYPHYNQNVRKNEFGNGNGVNHQTKNSVPNSGDREVSLDANAKKGPSKKRNRKNKKSLNFNVTEGVDSNNTRSQSGQPAKKLKMNLGNNEMFPTIGEAYNLPLTEGQGKKKRRHRKKKISEFCIPRLKLKLINISEQVQEEVLKQKTKKSGKSKGLLANQEATEKEKSNKVHLRPTRGANFRYKMNYEGKIEKRDVKKRKPSKLKRSQTNFASYLEFKQTSGVKKDDSIINELPVDQEPAHPELQREDPGKEDEISCKDDQNSQAQDLEEMIHTFTEIDHQNYYSSMNYKIKTMFLSSAEVRPNYSNTVLVREWINHTLCDELDISVFTMINNLNFRQILKKKTQPLKFKRRLAIGFKEVSKSLKSFLPEKIAKLVLLAVDIRKNPLLDGTDNLVRDILAQCSKKKIPVIFCGTRKEVGVTIYGKALARPAKVSAVGVIDYMGFEDEFRTVVEDLDAKKIDFKEKYTKFKDSRDW